MQHHGRGDQHQQRCDQEGGVLAEDPGAEADQKDHDRGDDRGDLQEDVLVDEADQDQRAADPLLPGPQHLVRHRPDLAGDVLQHPGQALHGDRLAGGEARARVEPANDPAPGGAGDRHGCGEAGGGEDPPGAEAELLGPQLLPVRREGAGEEHADDADHQDRHAPAQQALGRRAAARGRRRVVLGGGGQVRHLSRCSAGRCPGTSSRSRAPGPRRARTRRRSASPRGRWCPGRGGAASSPRAARSPAS